jgi:hypothetical protein
VANAEERDCMIHLNMPIYAIPAFNIAYDTDLVFQFGE